MKYGEDFVKRVVATVVERRCSARQAERLLDVPRRTIGRWLKRFLGALPYWFSRAARRVRNRTPADVLSRLRGLLQEGKSAVLAWLALDRIVCLRTVQRWKAAWFPPVAVPKAPSRRYERHKALSLGHTDWAVKRITNGVRCCFTFYVDDATRRLYVARAYPQASGENTMDALRRALRQAQFRAVLTDCGRVYSKEWGAACRQARVRPIHTRPYNPKCNGKAEAVVKKIKRFLSGFEVRDLEHANNLLRQFEREYNNTPHGSLKYRTPLQVFRYKQTHGDICAVR